MIKIRTEKTDDFNKVFNVHFLAFGMREAESKLVERIRVSEGFIPELSIVAEEDEELVGHILLSKATVNHGMTKKCVIVLAPIAVLPDYQRRNIGRMLINEGLTRARNLGFGLVMLIGHPEYYPKFGFKPARQFGLELTQYNVPDEVFMVCELKDGELGKIQGELIYPNSFF